MYPILGIQPYRLNRGMNYSIWIPVKITGIIWLCLNHGYTWDPMNLSYFCFTYHFVESSGGSLQHQIFFLTMSKENYLWKSNGVMEITWNYPVQGHNLLLSTLLDFPFSVEEGCFLFGILKKKEGLCRAFFRSKLDPTKGASLPFALNKHRPPASTNLCLWELNRQCSCWTTSGKLVDLF